MLRKVLAVFIGLIAAFVLITAIEAAGHAVIPRTGTLDAADPDRLRNYVAALPLGAFLFVLAAWSLATLAGGWIAGRIAGERPRLYALFVGAFVLAGAVTEMVMVPHPIWFMATAVAAISLMTWLAGRLVPERNRGA